MVTLIDQVLIAVVDEDNIQYEYEPIELNKTSNTIPVNNNKLTATHSITDIIITNCTCIYMYRTQYIYITYMYK